MLGGVGTFDGARQLGLGIVHALNSWGRKASRQRQWPSRRDTSVIASPLCCQYPAYSVSPSAPSKQAVENTPRATDRRWEAAVLILPFVLHFVLRLTALDGWHERIDVEELNFGLLPAHLLSGLAVDLLDYQTMWREGGSLVVAPFTAFFFGLLGPTYFALKVSGIAWHGLILLTWTGVVRLALGRREALLFGLLLACGPPFAAKMQLIALVGHPEGNLGAGLALLGLVLLLRETKLRHRQFGAALLGLSVTLGASFTYSAIPAVGLCLLIALRNRSRLRGAWRPLLTGLMLGSFPWFAYFFTRVDLAAARVKSGGSGLLSLFLGVSSEHEIYSSIPLSQRLHELLSSHLFWMWGWMAPNESYRGELNYPFGALLFLCALCAVFHPASRAFWRRAGRVEGSTLSAPRAATLGFAVLYVLSYLGIAVASGLSYGPDTYDGYRYLSPLFPALLLLASAGLGAGLRSTRVILRVAALAIATVLCGSFVLGGPSLSGLPGASSLHQLRGYNTHSVTRIFQFEMSQEERASLLAEPGRDLLDLSVAEGRRSIDDEGSLADLLSCPPAPVSCRLYVEGFSKDWVGSELQAPNAREQLSALVAALRGLTSEQESAGFRGMGRGISLNPPGPWWTQQGIPLLESLFASDQEKQWFHEGIGLDEPLFRDFHYNRLFGGGEVPEHLSYCRGVGMGVARLLLEPATASSPLPIPREILEPLSAPPWLERGVEAFEEGYEAERVHLSKL